jgi:hypothetical protein
MSPVLRYIIGGVAGGAIGFAIGYFGKCTSGACPLTSNPVTSTIIGAAIGIMLAAKP